MCMGMGMGMGMFMCMCIKCINQLCLYIMFIKERKKEWLRWIGCGWNGGCKYLHAVRVRVRVR